MPVTVVDEKIDILLCLSLDPNTDTTNINWVANKWLIMAYECAKSHKNHHYAFLRQLNKPTVCYIL